ncbi:hypothetical protein Acor_25980 [Acrocarpospora corrugata]|uniref:Uncharacterized protein n=1 Tax=Acrocarpospora corrugata TaxID=35763 RepID=A0A5M3VVK1_9ACTN|nr:hypothetical protein [Acrocarpospora corrugata]GES00534.1 hypothetical protein Acor_25980 [Acrocarpospora corrugata]
MNTEEALREAMSEHVAEVHASPMLGRSVRRRSRRTTLRLRTAGAGLVTAVAAVSAPVAMSLTAGPAVSVGAAPVTNAVTATVTPTETPVVADAGGVVEGVRVGYLPETCDGPGPNDCGIWVGVYGDGDQSLRVDGRLDGRQVAEGTYLDASGKMITRILDDQHGVLVVIGDDAARELGADTVERELRKIAEGLSLAG